MNINTTPSLLPNWRKSFLCVFYFFFNGWSNIGTNAKTGLLSVRRIPALLTLERAEGVLIDFY